MNGTERQISDDYRFAVIWIAVNDEPRETSAGFGADQISIRLIGALWGLEPSKIAADVRAVRAKAEELKAEQ